MASVPRGTILLKEGFPFLVSPLEIKVKSEERGVKHKKAGAFS